MAGSTAVYALRWQDLLDPPDGPNLGKHLAEDVEDELIRIDAKDPQFVRRITDDTPINNSTTLKSDSVLTLTAPINTVRRLSGLVAYTSNATPDFKFGFSFPAGASLTWTAGGHAITGSSGSGDFVSNTSVRGASDTTFGYGGADSPFVCALHVSGLFIMGSTPGALTVRYAQFLANASDTKTKTDSWLMLTPVS